MPKNIQELNRYPLFGTGEYILKLVQPCFFVLVYYRLIIIDDVDERLILQALWSWYIVTNAAAMKLLRNQGLGILAGDKVDEEDDSDGSAVAILPFKAGFSKSS